MRAAVVALLVLLAPATAAAYRTSEDSLYNQRAGIVGRIAFEPLPVPYAIFRASSDVPEDELRAATLRAFQTWTEPACSALTIRDDGTTTTPGIYGDDQNVIEWVESGWTGHGFGSGTIGVTTNQFLGSGGVWSIDESDMLLNGENYRWVIEGGEPDADPVDVQGLVVHEAGHFLGLLHPCEQTANDGAPACPGMFDETPTMAPIYTGQEQRNLTADDVAGICYLYPATVTPDAGVMGVDAGPMGSDAGTATADAGDPTGADAGPAMGSDAGAPPEDGGGCSCRASGGSSAGGWAVVGLLAALAWRRRPR